MRDLASQGSMYRTSSLSRTIVFIAMFLFALSGLLAGFSVAVFVRPNIGSSSLSKAGTHPIAQKNQTLTPKAATQNPIPLGAPDINSYNNTQIANGSTAYTVSSQTMDKKGKPVHNSGITCRLWIVPTAQDLHHLPPDRLKSPDTLQSTPLPGEVQGLIFDSTTPQTQLCNANGQGAWIYHIDPSVKHGYYYLVVLTDWKGVHYSWSWVTISIN